jgi:hypothetical protein
VSETLLARKFTDAIGAPFADAFRYQYAISERTLDLPEFEQTTLGPYNIYHSAILPAAQILSRDGSLVGQVLGFATTDEGNLLDGKIQLDVDHTHPDALARFEEFIRSLSGRYVVILCFKYQDRTTARLCIDCIGALSAMYDPESRICAASLLLCLNRDIDPHPVFKIPAEMYDFPEFQALLPGGPLDSGVQTTSFGGSFDAKVRQLMTNHVLDLTDFTAHRLELPEPTDGYLDPNDAAEQIVTQLNTTMTALQPTLSGYMAISGGLDSRMLVAAAPSGFSKQMTYYCYSDNWITGVDVRIAAAMATCVGERFIQQTQSETEDGSYFERPRRSLYFQKRCAVSSGLKTSGDGWWTNGYFRQLDRGAMWLRGNALEIVSARLWTPTVDAPLRKGLRHAMRRLGLATDDVTLFARLRQDMLNWLDTLPEHWRPGFHDFWYQELFLSHSQTAFLGVNELAYFPPASDHSIFQAARCVDPGLRRVNVLYEAILNVGRPELNEIPTTGTITKEIKQSGLDLEAVMSLHSWPE